MDAGKLKEIIELLPDLIVYIYPGYITVWLYYYSLGRKIPYDKYITVKCIVVSYLELLILNNLSFFPKTQLSVNLFLVVFSFGMGLSINHLLKGQWTKKLFKLLRLEVRLKSNDLERLCVNKTWLRVYLDQKGLMYEGKLRISSMPSEEEAYLILEHYELYLLEKSQAIHLIKKENNYVLIKKQDIERIEVICKNEGNYKKEL